MAYISINEMLADAKAQNLPLHEAILKNDCENSGMAELASRRQMKKLWHVMCKASEEYNPMQLSNSGLSGGQAQKVEAAAAAGKLLGGDYINSVTAEALKTAEANACMKRIVAAPTAGSCGVLPAVLLPLFRSGEFNEEQICDALYVCAAVGQVIAQRATLAGAEGGCQAEVGAASAMAAVALAYLKGCSPSVCMAAGAMALGNLLGLVCDPVAGLVEVPCVKRNVIGAVGAVSAANMAIAGVTFQIPLDEVIDAMGRIGTMMSVDLRETGVGGLAGTPTGQKIAKEYLNK